MDSKGLLYSLIATGGAVGAGWYLWSGLVRRRGTPAPPPPPAPEQDEDAEEDAPPSEEEAGAEGGLRKPNLEIPEIAAADALVHRWFGERLSGPRGMDKKSREAAIDGLVRDQGLTPGLAALVTYDERCRKQRLTPKRPPAEVRAAMRKLGIKR